MKRAIVIGSGIGGLSAAIRLQVQGFQVTVYESNDYPGGKLTAFEQNGFRFDAGPSLFTLPELVDELFLLAGEEPRQRFNYETVEDICNYFYEDGTLFSAKSDMDKLLAGVAESFGAKQAPKVQSYLKDSAYKYNTTSKVFLEQSLHRLSSYLSRTTLKALSRIASMDMMRSLHAVNNSKFDDPRLVQLFDRYATYNGSNPYKTPGIMSMIPHLEFGRGTYFPIGGMHSITQSLVGLAGRVGVHFEYNKSVSEIVVQGKAARGVKVGKEEIEADLVVSNMDIVPTYRELLPGLREPKRTLEQGRSSSALIYYWGINRRFDELVLHNIFFSSEYKSEFEHLFEKKAMHPDPTVYVHISSKVNPKDAPQGKENWFVMVNAPQDIGQDWERIRKQVRTNILNKLSRMLGVGIDEFIGSESVLDPPTIQERTSSFGGSLYGASSNHWLSAFLRHPNFHRKVKGLYFCGGSVHPGGGIPLAILSGKIVSELVSHDY